jgi:fermentation-respiration switch protein FrsA (DUF1100 family)
LYNNDIADWAAVLNPEAAKGVDLGVKRFGESVAVVCRGTVTPHEWIFNDLDSEFWRAFAGFPAIGDIPFGFSLGLTSAFAMLQQYRDTQVTFTGHSLGAAHASELCGMAVEAGWQVRRLVTFGSPRPGMMALRQLLAKLPKALYRNLSDPVCDVPTSPPFWHLDEFIGLEGFPPPSDPWGPLRDHHIELYAKAMINGNRLR